MRSTRSKRTISCLKFIKLFKILRKDGNMTESLDQSLKILAERHFPECQAMEEEWPSTACRASRGDIAEARKIVTLSGVLSAISSFSSFKTPGPDSIFPALLQWGKEILADRLVGIYAACIATGYVPKRWREARIVFLPKPGKGDYSDAKSFRPISLTSFLLKTLERVLVDHLEEHHLEIHPLNDYQHAYRAGRSTTTALHHLVRVVESELHVGGITMATFMDIEGAFDKVCPDKLSNALSKRGVNRLITKWVDNMLKNRAINAQSGGCRVRCRVTRGCPQGGVLSPLLWNITVDSLLCKLEQERIYTVGYADDIAILVRGKFLDTIVDTTATGLRIVEAWCREQDLSINAAKSDIVIFTRKRTGLECRPIRLFDAEIRISRSVKYLGVILDSKLTWNDHIADRIKKAKITLSQCRRVCGQKWGLSPKAMYWIYTMMVRPVVTYAALVWWEKSDQIGARKQLDRVQRLACVGIMPVIRTTPTQALERLLGLLPLDLFIKKVAAETAIRMDCDGTWCRTGSVKGHRRILDLAHCKVKEIRMPRESRTAGRVAPARFKVRLENTDTDTDGHSIAVFTDGSLSKGKAGAGIFSEELGIAESLSLGRYTTVFQAELIALIRALDYLTDRNVAGKEILLATDSLSVVRSIERGKISSKLIQECTDKLNHCSERNSVTVRWVRGHSGVTQNERADTLAKLGSAREFVGPEPYAALSKRTINSLIEDWLVKEHQHRWTETDGLRQAKMAIKWPSEQSRREFLGLSRGNLHKLAALVTGHGCFRHHLKTMHVIEDDVCRLCLEDIETAAHLMCVCPALARNRRVVLGTDLINEEDLKDIPYRKMLVLVGNLEELWGPT